MALLLFAVVLLFAPHSAAELLLNGDFENSLDGWYCKGGCNLATSNDTYRGSGSALVTGRGARWQGIAQDVTIRDDMRYSLTAYIKFLSLAPGTLYDAVQLVMQCLDNTNNDETVWTHFGKVERIQVGRWTKVGGFRLIRQGLHSCQVYVQIIGGPEVDYVIDDMVLEEVPELTNWRDEAESRIDSLRKRNLKIRMVKTVPGTYNIEVKQTRHLFGFGSAVGADQIVDPAYQKYQEFFFQNFEWAVIENALKWRLMEWNQGAINYERPDLALTALNAQGIKVRGHNVFWGVEKNVPSWVKDLSTTELEAEMQKRINGVVNFTKGRVEHWDVNNENLHGDWYEQALNDPDLTSQMFEDVNAVDSDVKLFLNEFGVLKTNMAMGLRNQALYFQDLGVPIHGVGIQSHLTPDAVDLTLFKKRLDAVAESGLPLWITELTVDHANATLKAHVLDDVMTLYFSHPAVHGILLWGFWDNKIWKANAALFEGPDLAPNEAGSTYLNLMQKWRTNETLELSETGSAKIKCFMGDYSVIVRRDGEVVKTYSVTVNKNKKLRIRIKK